MNTIFEEDKQYVAQTYARFPFYFTKGEGVYLYDDANKSYLDFCAGIGVNTLGYQNKQWMDATTNQIHTLQHVSNLYYSKPYVEVAKRLCNMSQMKKVFFANSGAEANEGVLKIARKYANNKYLGERSTIVTLKNSFHGRTINTLSATGQDSFHQNFGPFVDGFQHITPNDISELHAALACNPIAIMVEVIQGEGGVIALDKDYLKEIELVCKEHDILFIIDEVQSGIGRSGHLFSYMAYDLHPDLVSCAKGLGNGLPIGACLIGEKCQDVLGFGDHGTTFGGNPVACAGACVVLDTLDQDFLQNVTAVSKYIQTRVQQMRHVESINGMGLMLGVGFDESIVAREIVLACANKGVLFLTAKDRLRMLPPLILTLQDATKAMDVLEQVLNESEN